MCRCHIYAKHACNSDRATDRADNGAEPQGGADAIAWQQQRNMAMAAPMAAARGRAVGRGASDSLWLASAKPRQA